MKIVCGKTGAEDDMYDDAGEEEERVLFDATEESDSNGQFYWTQLLQQSFREELEK
jgi:phosphatidylinositol 4-kinase type 2